MCEKREVSARSNSDRDTCKAPRRIRLRSRGEKLCPASEGRKTVAGAHSSVIGSVLSLPVRLRRFLRGRICLTHRRADSNRRQRCAEDFLIENEENRPATNRSGRSRIV